MQYARLPVRRKKRLHAFNNPLLPLFAGRQRTCLELVPQRDVGVVADSHFSPPDRRISTARTTLAGKEFRLIRAPCFSLSMIGLRHGKWSPFLVELFEPPELPEPDPDSFRREE